jgi:hypothetical protein
VRRVALLALTVAAIVGFPSSALAAKQLESTFQDDNHLVYVTRAELRKTLDRLAGLGVDRLRITVLWKVVAPSPDSRQRPNFDAVNPDAYPKGAWDRYDNIVYEAAARGIKVNFNVTGPVPLWATQAPPRPDVADTYEPDPVEFGRFVRAVGTRYSGTYPPSDGPYVDPMTKIPRVDYWSIWNEPNQSGWLTPQWTPTDGSGKRFVERASVIYRALVFWAYAGLTASGHTEKTDTILVGETAPGGLEQKGVKKALNALLFVRTLYCVDSRHRALKGARAKALGCGSAKTFRRDNPGLFLADGFAHHPYNLLLPPNVPPRSAPDHVNIASLGRLTKTLDRIFRTYKSTRKLPLYLTEYGYQTNPPDTLGVKWAKQAAYLNQSEYMAWRHPRVKTLAQFLLFDDKTDNPANFQSGLLTIDGRVKPSLAAYRLPLWVYRQRGSTTSLWGRLRTAPTGATASAVIQVRSKGSSKWRKAKTVKAKSPSHAFTTTVKAKRGARVRLAYGGVTSRVHTVR